MWMKSLKKKKKKKKTLTNCRGFTLHPKKSVPERSIWHGFCLCSWHRPLFKAYCCTCRPHFHFTRIAPLGWSALVWKQASTLFCNYKENKKNNIRMLDTLFIEDFIDSMEQCFNFYNHNWRWNSVAQTKDLKQYLWYGIRKKNYMQK